MSFLFKDKNLLKVGCKMKELIEKFYDRFQQNEKLKNCTLRDFDELTVTITGRNIDEVESASMSMGSMKLWENTKDEDSLNE